MTLDDEPHQMKTVGRPRLDAVPLTPAQRKRRSRNMLLERSSLEKSELWTRSVCLQILARPDLDGSPHSAAALARLISVLKSS